MESKYSDAVNELQLAAQISDDESNNSSEETYEDLDLVDGDAEIERFIEKEVGSRMRESLDVTIEDILAVLETPELQHAASKGKRDAVMGFLKNRVPCPWVQGYYRGPLNPCR